MVGLRIEKWVQSTDAARWQVRFDCIFSSIPLKRGFPVSSGKRAQ